MEEILIHTDFIKLNQLLKWIAIAESGAEANQIISEGYVKVNDELEVRRGKKIYPGDRVLVGDDHEFLIVREGCAEVASKRITPDKL